MALIKADRVKETTATVGTGAFTLAGAVSTYRTFASVMAVDLDVCYYTAINQTTGEWETGRGILSDANTLQRGWIFANSNGNLAKVNFGAGVKEVFMSSQAALICAADGTSTVNYVNPPRQNISVFTTGKTYSFEKITTGIRNVVIGDGAGSEYTTASYNVAIGSDAMALSQVAGYNIAIGFSTLGECGQQSVNPGSTCMNNVCIGYYVADNSTSLDDSVLIGTRVKTAGPSETNVIVIGSDATSNGSNTTTIGNSSTTDCHLFGNVIPTGAFRPASIADSSAPSNAIYYSTTASKLVYKDSGGTVNNLY